jgi:hypothetical protein
MNRIAAALISTSLSLVACVEPADGPDTATTALAIASDEACYGKGNFPDAKAPPLEPYDGYLPQDKPEHVWLLVDLDAKTSAAYLVDVDHGQILHAASFPREEQDQVVKHITRYMHGQFGGIRIPPGGSGPIGPVGDDPYRTGRFLLETGMRMREAPFHGNNASM